jgi:uncharacterized protein (DUF885 family)
MPHASADTLPAKALAHAADDIMETLANRFPVCLSSDEFHFFPQALSRRHRWDRWDDFSADAVADLIRKINRWQKALNDIESTAGDEDTRIDADVLKRILTTLSEQLEAVCFHRTQPTFYLTIAAIGLAEALEDSPAAFDQRMAALPRFLNRAEKNLVRIPELYRMLGCEMTHKIHNWLQHLSGSDNARQACLTALAHFQQHLEHIPTTSDFRLPQEVYERIAREHIGCRMPLDRIREHLQSEIDETERILITAAGRQTQHDHWQALIESLPSPQLPPDGQSGLYSGVIWALSDHCRKQHMIADALVAGCPVNVATVPEHLEPVRSTAAYSMPPGHPPAVGTFYISRYENASGPPADYRLLTAHETFPGHHLLDATRWNLNRRLRRHIEFPIYYEGWASFSEEILFDTGFFGDAADRLLMAKRRYWRAMRGMIDLDIQTGARSLENAATHLSRAGLNRGQAAAMVKRYALKPGYQLCYTIGRRQFERLYRRFNVGSRRPSEFVRRVLAQGEIGIDNLEKVIL